MLIKRTPIFLLAFIAAAFAKEIVPAVPSLSGGCYQISTAEELYGFAEIVNGKDSTDANPSVCGELTKDVVVNEGVLNGEGRLNSDSAETLAVWKPIASFSGNFNGNGHTISGLYSPDNAGLFEFIYSPENSVVVVKDLGIIDSYFSSTTFLGVLADAVLGEGEIQITNFYSLSTIESTSRSPHIAGVVGYVGESTALTLTNCYSAGKLLDSRDRYYSDLLGYIVGENIKVNNSYAVKGSYSSIEYGTLMDSIAFRNGVVTFLLKENSDGAIWGQDVGNDLFPDFSGTLKNSIANRYSVTFHTFDGDTASYFNSYVSGLNTALPETVEKENTVFYGWYSNSTFDGMPDTLIADTVEGNLEYWAKLKNRYNIYFHCGGGELTRRWSANLIDRVDFEDTIYTYIEGAQALLPDASHEGRIFLGWYDNEELTGEPVDLIVKADVGDKHFYASWFNMSKPELDIADNCYAISDKAELYGFAAMVRGTYGDGEDPQPDLCGKLTKDIVVNENVLKRNGTPDSSRMSTFMKWTAITVFSGIFDGQDHKISGLYRSPLFGSIYAGKGGKSVVIRNLKVNDSYGDGSGLVDYVNDSTFLSMDNCHYSGYVDGGNLMNVGGLVRNSYGYISMFNSSFEGIVFCYGRMFVGGLVGQSFINLVLVQNYMKGRIVNETPEDATSSRLYGAGSLVGHMTGHGFIANNYSIVDFTGEASKGQAGGLIGGLNYTTSMGFGRSGVTEYRILQSVFLNNYSKGSTPAGTVFYGLDKCVVAENNFYLKGNVSGSGGAIPIEESAFTDGTLQTALHDYVQKDSSGNAIVGGINGNVWVQGVDYPEFAQQEKMNVIYLEQDTLDALNPYILYKPGQSVQLPSPVRKDFAFMGWYTTPDFSGEPVTEIVATDSDYIILYAKWEIMEYTVSLAIASSGGRVRIWANNSGSFSPSDFRTMPYGTKVRVDADAYDGYAFVKWDDDYCGTKKSCSFVLTEDVSLKAYFEKLSSSSVTSSSSVASSSSIASSSSEVKSSSSSAMSSSSSEVASSSSSVAKSSSSTAKSSSSADGKSSSSKGKDAIVAMGSIPQFSLMTVGRSIQVSAARVGATYAVFDLQGHIMTKGRVGSANFNLKMGQAGTYLVRIGNQTQSVSIK